MSSNNIEIEAKVLLSKKDYERLLANIPFNPQVKVQENYFLDSEDRELKKYGMLVRLRRREGRNPLLYEYPDRKRNKRLLSFPFKRQQRVHHRKKQNQTRYTTLSFHHPEGKKI